MAHEVHTTKTIVLGSANVQDADKLFWLLTEDFGLLFASAKSIREEVSKLRYALQDLASARVSLVRGRGMWRITGAEEMSDCRQYKNTHHQKAFGRVALLTRRLFPQEEKNEELFQCIQNMREALYDDTYDVALIEAMTVARILYHLGYFAPQKDDAFVKETSFSHTMVQNAQAKKELLLQRINQGLADSQL